MTGGRRPWDVHRAAVTSVVSDLLRDRTFEPTTDEERALMADLEAVGVNTGHFGFFTTAVATTFDFDAAAPVLIPWLSRAQDSTLKETIARSLTGIRRHRSEAARALVEEFRRSPADWEHEKWAFGNALETLADPDLADDLIELLRDRRHGRARQMLCGALRKTKDVRAPDVLIELIDDSDVSGHSILALRELGPKSSLPHLQSARSKLERVAGDENESEFARRQARKALERVESL